MGEFKELLFHGIFKDPPEELIEALQTIEMYEKPRPEILELYPELRVDWLHQSSYYTHPQSIFKISYDKYNDKYSIFIFCSIKSTHIEEIPSFISLLSPLCLDGYHGYLRDESGEIEWL